ncbi:hypothetical protein [Oceanobacillus rekensis]|uniref:hypothetical protein n=1 Tax=Oceanobacillus rekensis TaxID=937927 RepID=UPI000B44E24D|nr:hypothetical protein [Oceanobacillus rekensis]
MEYKKDLKQSKSKKSEEIVTVLGNSLEHNDVPIVWKGKDMFTHMLVVGVTRSENRICLGTNDLSTLNAKETGQETGFTGRGTQG